MTHLGDFKEDGDIYHKFTTRAFATGIPTQLAGTPVLSVYINEEDGTEKTSAEAYFDLDVDFDTKTGLNNIRIDLSGDAFFATGADYAVVITTGTVGGVSVVGETICTFSIENRSMGQPAGATLSDDIAAIKTEVDKIGVIPALDGGAQTVGAAIAKLADDNAGATFDAGTDSLNKIRDDRTLAAADYTIVGDLGTVQSGDSYARIGAPVGASISADIADLPTVAEFEARTIVSADYTIVADLGTVQSGDSFARIGAPAGASISADIADIPTVAEFEARTIVSADYVVVGDTIAGVTLVTTTTDVTNDVGITQAAADKAWGTAVRVLTANTNLNDPTTAQIVAQEVDNDGVAISLAEALRLCLSALTAKSSGGGTATIVFRDIADSKTRISATVDANGNRTAVGTRDAT